MFNVESFIKEYNVKTASMEDKHYRRGWINIKCPFCSGGEGFHLGYSTTSHFWICYRCGWKSGVKVVSGLLGISFDEADKVYKKFGGSAVVGDFEYNQEGYEYAVSEVWKDRKLTIPFSDSLGNRSLFYLRSRGMEGLRNNIEYFWGAVETKNYGPDKFRLIAPIRYKGKTVSYIGRDLTEKSKIKYKACSEKDAIVNHKLLLYGFDEAVNFVEKDEKKIIIVEGIFDVWKVGPGAVATFGVEFTNSQLLFLLNNFDVFFVAYDMDEPGRIAAKKLSELLSSYGKETYNVQLPGGVKDLAELSDKRAMFFKSMVFQSYKKLDNGKNNRLFCC